MNKPSKTAKPLVATAVAIAAFGLINVMTGYLYRPQQTVARDVSISETVAVEQRKPWSWWLCKYFLREPKAPEIVLFGSSQMGSALITADAQTKFEVLDALTHRRAATLEKDLVQAIGKQTSVFSLAAPGEMVSDAYLISKALFKDGRTPRCVVIGIAPRDFIDASMPCAASTEPWKFFSRFASPGRLNWAAYEGDCMTRLQFAVDGLPLKRAGTDLTSAFTTQQASEQRPNSANPIAAISGVEAIPGAWKVPANIPADLWADNTKEYKNRFKKPESPLYQAELSFFQGFLREMKEANIPVLVVGMPSLPMNRALLSAAFWNKFRTDVASTCTTYDATWLDLTADPSFTKSHYLDTVHLNAKGGMLLFDNIARSIAANRKMLAALNSNDRQIAGHNNDL